MSESLLDELSLPAEARDTAITIGVFDGVHRGHRFLMQTLQERARARGFASVIVTLHPHPALVLNPNAGIVYLTTLQERVSLLRETGVDYVLPLTFTREIAALSAREFVALLRERLRMRFFLIGPDFALGRGREGSVERLTELGAAAGFEVESVDAIVEGGVVVSSTAIRAALDKGDMATVNNLLGRPFSLRGPVVRGVERGKVIGFPTANIAVGPVALPPFGVYVTRAAVEGISYDSVTNIGRRPTFDDGERSVEVHIMDFDGDLYDKEMHLDILERLRGEVRFANADALAEQIRKDVVAAREYLSTYVEKGFLKSR